MKADDVKVEAWPPPPTSGMLTGHVSAGIKITHKATGMTVTCETERSQHANREKAMQVLEVALGERTSLDNPQLNP